MLKNFLLMSAMLFSTLVCCQSIDGTWQFESITKEGQSLFDINTEADYLTLESGAFNYTLEAKNNLEASGTYQLNDHLLTLNYRRPKDTIRSYELRINQDTLVLKESGVIYQFIAKSIPSQIIPIEESNTQLRTSTPPAAVSEGLSISLESLGRGLLGLTFLVLIGFLLSSNRRRIDWRLVGTGLLLQVIFAVLVLKVDRVALSFDWLSQQVVTFLNFSEKGAEFLFGGLVNNQDTFGYIFAFKVLPTVVFFSAFTSVLYYFGIIQRVIKVFAWVMSRTMRLSGAESLAAAANIFIGQTEAPLVVKPYLDKMTKSELMCLMVGGMATIAGGVLAAYIAFLGGSSEAEKIYFAKHLLTASIMSAPAAIVIAKMLYPETETVDRKLDVSREKIGTNVLDAIARGTTDGLKLAINVGAMLLVFTALIAVFNWITVDWIGGPTGLNDQINQQTAGRYTGLSLQYILGNLFAPVAWIIGVPSADIISVGQLLGEKTILNEFFAYASLSDLKNSGLLTSNRSIVIATYSLCGFANFASIGIQIGGIGGLAPSQQSNLAKFGIKALIGGTIAALMTATIAGMLIG
ncbi:MAG: lipocalin family protein [Bacteroidetes bacterium]|nr:lipocalin family protein [Flavobacteriaceae bacterium]MDA0719575.1 lipocalin family protein [Bacteroidota bacterium]MDA1209521.1 lipocalin family protein [Bacteroidota bacterium]